MSGSILHQATGPLTVAQRRYKRDLLAWLAAELDNYQPQASDLPADEAHQVRVELQGELWRRAAGRWRTPR